MEGLYHDNQALGKQIWPSDIFGRVAKASSTVKEALRMTRHAFRGIKRPQYI